MTRHDSVMLRAHRLLDEDRVHEDVEHPGVWVVDSLSNVAQYRVQTDWNPETKSLTYATCTCPSGLHTGVGDPRCHHVAAVLIILLNEKLAKESS